MFSRKKGSEHKFRFHATKLRASNIIVKAKKAYEREGLSYLVRIGMSKSLGYFLVHYYRIFRSNETFEFQGTTYNYFFHAYCTTWGNERTVAVPIVWKLVKKYEDQKKKILEVGNVISHYFKVNHDIVDKYEIMNGVINEDIVDFKTSKQYDLIVSIVTLEHVGWSELPRDPSKMVRALENLRALLSPGGHLVVVIGLGLNNHFDTSLKNNTIEFTKQSFLKHINGFKWQEANWEDVKDLKYNKSIPTARGIMIGTIVMN